MNFCCVQAVRIRRDIEPGKDRVSFGGPDLSRDDGGGAPLLDGSYQVAATAGRGKPGGSHLTPGAAACRAPDQSL